MKLLPGVQFCSAEHFQLPGDWPSRLQLSSGIRCQQGNISPQLPWRTPTAEELEMLLRADDAIDPREVSVQYFNLPRHLLEGWWQALEDDGIPTNRPWPAFNTLVTELTAFFQYKRLPVPPGGRFDLSLGTNPSGLEIMGSNHEQANASCWAWGGVNLGVDALELNVLNLTSTQWKTHPLAHTGTTSVSPQEIPSLNSLESTTLDYPLLRLSLQPGEGYRLPSPPPMIYKLTAADGAEPMMLYISGNH